MSGKMIGVGEIVDLFCCEGSGRTVSYVLDVASYTYHICPYTYHIYPYDIGICPYDKVHMYICPYDMYTNLAR